MKSIVYFFVVIIITSTLFTSCRKDDENNGIAPADSSIAKYLFDATKDEVDQQMNLQAALNGYKDNLTTAPRNGCATINISPLGIAFPKTVTIVFPQGCTTFAGASIEGSVVISISGKIRENGTTATFLLADFQYKNYTLSGNYLVTFSGNNMHTTQISNGKVVTPEGKTITYQTTNTSTQTEGNATTFKTNPTTFLQDDVYFITTVSEGINSKGNNYSVTTEKQLKYKVSCQWITEGKIIINEEARPLIIASIDYGNDVCDNKATLMINNVSSIITLP